MSDMKRVILLPLDEKEMLALVNCAAVGFSILTTGELDERVYGGAASSLTGIGAREWNSLQMKIVALMNAALPEIKTSSFNVSQAGVEYPESDDNSDQKPPGP
jgi:hypothetical protein